VLPPVYTNGKNAVGTEDPKTAWNTVEQGRDKTIEGAKAGDYRLPLITQPSAGCVTTLNAVARRRRFALGSWALLADDVTGLRVAHE